MKPNLKILGPEKSSSADKKQQRFANESAKNSSVLPESKRKASGHKDLAIKAQKSNTSDTSKAAKGPKKQNHDEFIDMMEPILFGAKITIEAQSAGSSWMLHSDGFINSRPYLRNAKGNMKEADLLTNDSSNSIFQLLPFSSFSNFQIQNKLASHLDNFELTKDKILEDRYEDKELTLSGKQMTLETLKQQLWDETATNRSIFEKMKGAPLFYENSTFLLLHCNSLKFLNVQASSGRKLQ